MRALACTVSSFLCDVKWFAKYPNRFLWHTNPRPDVPYYIFAGRKFVQDSYDTFDVPANHVSFSVTLVIGIAASEGTQMPNLAWVNEALFSVTTGILLVRTWALWDRNRRIGIILFIIFLGMVLSAVANQLVWVKSIVCTCRHPAASPYLLTGF